jgi:hypothetical protein
MRLAILGSGAPTRTVYIRRLLCMDIVLFSLALRERATQKIDWGRLFTFEQSAVAGSLTAPRHENVFSV